MDHKLTLEYCTSWGYSKKATRAVELLVDKYDKHFTDITLKPSDGGRFELAVDNKMVFSKLDSDRFPEDDEMLELVANEIGAS